MAKRGREPLRQHPTSQQPAELVVGQPGIPDDVPHGDGIDRVVARDRLHPRPVAHHDVLALPDDLKAHFLQGPDRILMVDARERGHAQTSTSTSRVFAPCVWDAITSRYSRMASAM